MIKSIQSDEIFNTPFISNKSWALNATSSIQTVEEGYFVSSSYLFYDSASAAKFGQTPADQNNNGTYKRLVYQLIKNSYYNDNIAQSFGLETTDADKVFKVLQNTCVRITLPRIYFGESIQTDSVVIYDYSKDKDYTLYDDTYGNLYVDGTHFINYVDVKSKAPTTTFTNGTVGPVTLFGHKAEAHGIYAAIGNPNPQYENQNGTGSVDVYRFNAAEGIYTYYGTAQSMKASNTSGTSGTGGTFGTGGISVIRDGYGLSFDVHNNVFVVGDPYFSGSYNGVTYPYKSLVDVYLLNPTSSAANVLAGSLFSATKVNSPINTDYNTFGNSVSLNNKYLVVGANGYNDGTVYVYSYTTSSLNTISISASPTTVISSIRSGKSFGTTVCIDKSGSNSILIAETSSLENPQVYLFESASGGWSLTHTFSSVTGSQNVPFDNIQSYNYVKNSYDKFGHDIRIHGNTIVIGAPEDASYYEYSGSTTQHNRGAAYIYNKTDCPINSPDTSGIYVSASQHYWDLIEKYIGDDYTIKDNKLGCSVDVFNNKVLIGCVSSSNTLATKANVSSSISQSFDDVNLFNGQYVLLEKTGSVVSAVTYDYKKKSIGYPYMSYGYDVAISEKCVVIGSPFVVSDFTSSNSFLVSPTVAQSDLTNMCGHAYISTIDSLRTNYHAGNVFYRNGEIVLSNTGSQFQNIFKTNDTNQYKYDLQYDGKVTINERSVICVVNPGEFNVSTNSTALNVTRPTFDLFGDGETDFRDINLILLYITDVNTPGNPNFEDDNTFWTPYVIENESEQSLLDYYKSLYEYGQYTLKLEYSYYKPRLVSLESQFDFDGDGKVSLNDAKILWKFFINRLDIDTYNKLLNPFSTRKTLSDVVFYLTSKISKYSTTNGIPTIDSEFENYQQSASLDITGSYLAPYITTVGLYSDSDLVAVAKLSTPIKNTGEYPLNFLIKWDV